MIDYSKLTQVVDGKKPAKKSPKKDVPTKKTCVTAEQKQRIKDSLKKKARLTEEQKKQIKDSLAKKRADSKKYATFKVTDSYKALSKKIKDALEDTETTEDAINVGTDALTEAPAEQVVAAVIEVLGEAIDILQAQCDENCEGDECEECEEGASDSVEGAEAAEVADTDSDKKVEDSVNVTVANEAGEIVTVDTQSDTSTVSADVPVEAPMAPEAPMAEEPMMEEPMAPEAPAPEAPIATEAEEEEPEEEAAEEAPEA